MINVQQACRLLQLFTHRLVHIYGRQPDKRRSWIALASCFPLGTGLKWLKSPSRNPCICVLTVHGASSLLLFWALHSMERTCVIYLEVSSIRTEGPEKSRGSGAGFPGQHSSKGCSMELAVAHSNIFHAQSQTYNSGAEHSGSVIHTWLISDFKTTVGKKLSEKTGSFLPRVVL